MLNNLIHWLRSLSKVWKPGTSKDILVTWRSQPLVISLTDTSSKHRTKHVATEEDEIKSFTFYTSARCPYWKEF
jgi:hypothetical protein